MWDHIPQSHQIGSALTYDHVGMHPTVHQNGFALTFDHVGTHPIVIRMAPHLHLIMWEHIPQSHQNGSTLTSDHVGTHSAVTLEWPSTPG